MGFFVFVLGVVAIAMWRRLTRVDDLVHEIRHRLTEQEAEIRRLANRVKELAAPEARQTAAEQPAAPVAHTPKPAPLPPSPAPLPMPPAPRVPPPPVAAPAPPEASLPPAIASALPPLPEPPRVIVRPAPPRSPLSPASEPPAPPEPPPPPSGPRFELPAFDWEQLVGVRLFSAIAGIALVLAGILFLRYSIEHGWLSPTVRVIIGVLTGITLLVVCERKAARKYPVTANALDAAAIAILFSTFFAAHSLWKLIPATVTFGLLALVTATAVMLAIRRESLFIAVLGLLGGFATPALLSTGENRPIGLFSYLLLLNIGLAWVAYRQRWPVLTAITLVLTTVYQWGWVFKYLDAGQLPLAAGIFVVFALIGFGSLILSSSRATEGAQAPFAKTALIAAGMPLLFAVYFAAVPAYRDNYWLLFGFLLLVDLGLFAIAIAGPGPEEATRAAVREPILHATGAMVTLLVFGVWLSMSYSSAAWPEILGITSVFVLFYLFAPEIAARVERPLNALGEQTIYAAPILLFALVVLIRREPATEAPWAIFGTLLALLGVMAWRAVVTDRGAIYYVAAFLALAAEALWSGLYLRIERLDEAVVLYAVFALVYLAIPVVARRAGRPLEPEEGGGVVLLASLAMLLYLSGGSIAPQALFGFALLLAILNAALFVESAAVRTPNLAFIGSALSWILMGLWWLQAAVTVGILSSLLVLVGLTLLMTGGYAWARAQSTHITGGDPRDFQPGFFLALAGHLFLFVAALQPALAIPPWPLFAALAVMTVALLASALAYANGALHAAAVIAATLVMMSFAASATQAPWPTGSLAGFAVVGSVALLWILLARRAGFESIAAGAAAGALFLGVFGAMMADAQPGAPDPRLLVAFYVGALAFVLFLTARYTWRHVALAAAVVAGIAAAMWQVEHLAGGEGWQTSLWGAGALFGLFVVYPLVLGSRSKDDRDPYLAAIIASAWFFFVARHALMRGGLESIIGVLPVVLGAIMAMLLRQLLRIQPAGARDLGRLALVAATSLGFVTVAIPLQLREQWITIGWALEGAALAWLFGRIPHRGLLYWSAALLAVVFVRLALNPDIFTYEPRGELRIFNWYLYTYMVAAGAMFLAAWWLSKTRDVLVDALPRLGYLLSAAGAILLFVLLNIEIADFYATGPDIMFRFGVTIAQDLTYTIGWLVFGLGMLAAGILLRARPARVASVVLIAVTTLKCFLYDLRSLEGLYRIAAFVGLAISLTLVSLAIQKYVRATPEETA